jgi:signal transduction histidine kinase
VFDADKLEKIVTNLLSNAYKFTPAGGKVVLSAAVQEKDAMHGMLQLSVSDTGIGIPAGQVSRIFERFHQVDTSTTRDYEGTGIGLALVKELVDLHGGTISLESSQGAGTTFSLTLPLARWCLLQSPNRTSFCPSGQSIRLFPCLTPGRKQWHGASTVRKKRLFMYSW